MAWLAAELPKVRPKLRAALQTVTNGFYRELPPLLQASLLPRRLMCGQP